jgi:nucleoside-diphosphate-sugar epimerase
LVFYKRARLYKGKKRIDDRRAMARTAIVFGGGGFIGSHLVKKLKEDGFWIRAVDLKYPEYWSTYADEFVIGDLRDKSFVSSVLDKKFDEVYQLAADMGGAGYINTGDNDSEVMGNSVLINVNVLKQAQKIGISGVFFSSTACVYPEHNQINADAIDTREDSVYPANPDTEYGWEKLFSERLYLAYNKNYNMKNKIARYHNIYGPYGTWTGGKEKSPAAICRKVISSVDSIEIWGDGNQCRSFLYIDECIRSTIDFYRNDKFFKPINIGSSLTISINELVDIVCSIENKKIEKIYIDGPVGVKARTSNNELIERVLGYKPNEDIVCGISKTYQWIKEQVLNA